MDIRHLNYFLAVAEELSFSAASRLHHVSQSALSRAVKELEEEVGVRLLDRSTARVRLTPEGERFQMRAVEILGQLSDAVLEVRQMGETPSTRLEVGYITPALDSFLQETLGRISERHPDLSIHLHDLNPQSQVQKLEEGTLDVALIGGSCRELQSVVDLTPICHIPLCVVVGADHRFAARKSLRLTECRDEPFIGLREDTFPGRKHLIQSLCTQAGFTPEFAATADSLNSLLALVRSGKGLSLVPRDIQNILPRGLRLVNIRSPICRVEFSAAVRRGEPRPLVLMFLEECRQVAGRVFEHS